MATYTQLPSGSWRVHIRRAGFPVVSRTFKTKADAEAFALVEEGSLIKRRADVPHSVIKSNFANVVADYFKSPAFKNKAESTRSRELNASRPVLSYFADYDLSLIKPSDIQKYFDSRSDFETYRKKPISGDTLRLEKAFLSSVFNFGVLRDYCVMNPTKHLRFEYKKPTPRDARLNLTPPQFMKKLDEFERASTRLNPSFLYYLLVLHATGMRPGELSRLKLDYIDYRECRIRIPRAANKNRTERVFSFNKGAFHILFSNQYKMALRARSPYLFYSVSPSGEFVPLSYAKPMRRFLKFIGAPAGFVPHSFRHERISYLFESTNYTDSEIALIVGDVNPLSLLRYRHLHMEKIRDKVSDTLIDLVDDNSANYSLTRLIYDSFDNSDKS